MNSDVINPYDINLTYYSSCFIPKIFNNLLLILIEKKSIISVKIDDIVFVLCSVNNELYFLYYLLLLI